MNPTEPALVAPSLIVYFHIWAGTIAILSGFAALFLKKGSRMHRVMGNVFFASMMAMGTTGAVRALILSQTSNVMGGLFADYMTATAWLTVWRKENQTGRVEIAMAVLAIGLGIANLAIGWQAANTPNGFSMAFPAGPSFFFGTVALLAGFADIRTIVRGGVAGAQRILRHLWRMCFALFFATASLFLGQARVFPEALRHSPLLYVPVLVVVAMAVFWVIRVRFGKAYRKTLKTTHHATTRFTDNKIASISAR
jgi:uncharacterized membrane protein